MSSMIEKMVDIISRESISNPEYDESDYKRIAGLCLKALSDDLDKGALRIATKAFQDGNSYEPDIQGIEEAIKAYLLVLQEPEEK